MFSNKLNFLMDLCGEKNTELSNYLQIDPSYISRLRAGTRQLTKNHEYLHKMGRFFAERQYEDFQIVLLSNTINKGEKWPETTDEQANIIYEFLADNETDNIERLFNAIAEKTDCYENDDEDYIPPAMPTKFSLNKYYFGAEGEKEAVLDFMRKVISNGKPREIYTYSDDELLWLDDTDDFFNNFLYLAIKATEFGCTFNIIHKVNQSLEELYDHSMRWLPLYLTGKVKPLYFKNINESIVKKITIIAKDLCAVLSTIMANNTSSSILTHSVEDTIALKSLLEDFSVFTNDCIPLMQISTMYDTDKFKSNLKKFNKPIVDSISRNHNYSVFSLNKLDILEITDRINSPKLVKIWESYVRGIKKTLEENTFTEIIGLANPDKLKAGNEKMSIEYQGDNIELDVNVETYLRHLRRIIKNLKKFPNYYVRLNFSEYDSLIVHTKKDEATCVFKAKKPTVMFTFTNPYVNDKAWKFLEGDRKLPSKEETIKALKDYMDLF